MTGEKKRTDWKAEAQALRAEVARLRHRCTGLERMMRDAGVDPDPLPVPGSNRVDDRNGVHATLDVPDHSYIEQLDADSLRLLSTVLETIPDAVYVKDAQGRHRLMNSAGARMVGLAVEDVLGRDDAALFDAATASRLRLADKEVMAERQSRTFLESVSVRGECREFLTTKSPLADLNGGVAGVVGISRDVTGLRRAADDMRRQKEVLQTIFDHIPIMISAMDASGQVEMVNRQWEMVLGWSTEEARREDVVAACYPDPSAREHVLSVLANPPDGWTDVRTRVRDGRVIDTSWQVVTLSDGQRISFGQDITERKRTARALEESAWRLQAMSRRLVEVQEQERRLLARALHDDVGQLLIALRYALEASARGQGAGLDRARVIVRATLSQLSTLSNRLHPEMLDHMGLLPALRALFDNLLAQGRVAVDFVWGAGLERRFATQIESTVYRLIEEAVINVARHAAVGEAAVRLWSEGDCLHVQVEDAGKGFHVELMPNTGEMSRIRERVDVLGGELSIASAPGEGTQVMATLPTLRQEEAEA